MAEPIMCGSPVRRVVGSKETVSRRRGGRAEGGVKVIKLGLEHQELVIQFSMRGSNGALKQSNIT